MSTTHVIKKPSIEKTPKDVSVHQDDIKVVNKTKKTKKHKSNKSNKHGNNKGKLSVPTVPLEKYIRSTKDLEKKLKKIHIGSSKMTCSTCSKPFSIRSQYVLHLTQCKLSITSSSSKRATCHFCIKSFHNRKALKKHIRCHNDQKEYPCATCGNKFRLKHQLKSHQLQVHKALSTSSDIHACDECDKSFLHKYELQRHCKMHSNEHAFSCVVCQKKFTQKFALELHQQTHSGEQNFTCVVCGAEFQTQMTLKYHFLIHETGSSLSSQPSDKRTKPNHSKRTLNSSKINNTKDFCKICGKGFNTKLRLKIHMAVHPTAPSIQCQACGKRFKQRLTYIRHVCSQQSTSSQKAAYVKTLSLDSLETKV